MISRIFDRKEFYVIASILLAFMFWFFVRQVEDPEQSRTISGVPVVLTNEGVLESQGLTVSELSVEEVSLQVYANISVLDELSKDNISVTLDVSKYGVAGEYESTYVVELPNNIKTSGVVIENRAPQKIFVTIEKLYAETFPIEFVLKGSIADGYQAGEYTLSTESVLVTGSVEEVSKIDQAIVTLERENLNERFAADLPIQLIDADGNVLTDLQVELSEKATYVILPVVVVKEIPLTISYTEGGGATESDIASIQISPSSITVSGAEEDMATLSEISLGAIDLSKVVGGETFDFAINLDPSLTNVSGSAGATVSIRLDDLATKTFDVTNIELFNIPSGYIVSTTTQMRSVIVRGDQAALDMIDPSQLRIVADLSQISAMGNISVPVKVYLDATTQAGVIGEYSIIVNVTG